MTTIKEIIQSEGGPAEFSRRWEVPLDTVKKWSCGASEPCDWLVPILSRAIAYRECKKK